MTSNKYKVPPVIFYVTLFIWIYIVLSNFLKYHKINIDISYLFIPYGQFEMSNFIKLLANYFFAIILLAGILIGAIFIGNIICHLFRIKYDSVLEKTVFSLGFGLGSLAYITLFIGLMGLLYKPVFYILWIILIGLGIKNILPITRTINLKSTANISLMYKFIIGAFLILSVFNLAMSFTPEMYYDSLNYHLGIPNYYKVHNRILPMPFKAYSHFPLTVSMLYTMGIVLKDVMLAKLINWSFGVFTVLGIIYFCKKHFKSITMGIISSAAFYFTPTIITKSWTAANEIGLTFFTFLSLAALINTLMGKNKIKWLMISGIFAGLVMGTKYTGIFFIFGLSMLLVLNRLLLKEKFKNILIWSIISIAIFSPWLIKNYIECGNPVHPFLSSHFKIKYPNNINCKNSERFYSNPTTNTSKIINLLTLPWELSIQGGGTSKYGSPSYYMVGSVFILFIPFLIFIKKDDDIKIIYKLLLFSLFSYIFWAIFGFSRIKYYSPAIPALSIIAGYTISKVYNLNKLAGNICLFVFSVLILNNFFFLLPIAHNSYKPFSILTGSLNLNQYLSTSQPGYPYPSYSAYNYINNNTDKTAKVLIFGDAKCFYIKRRFIASDVAGMNPLIEYLKNVNSADEYYNFLLSQGFTHIVVNMGEGIRTAGYDTLYFSKRDFEILDGFWKKYVKEIYKSNGVYLYEILSEEEAEKPHAVPVNTVKATYRNYKFNNAAKHIKNKKWTQALEEFNDLLDKNISDHQIFYLTSVCYYYKGEYENSKKYVNMAYKIKQDTEYKKLLDVLNKK